MKEKNKHLTLTHRQQIEALLLAGVSKSEIAGIIGCCLKTLYNEIRRGTTTIYGEDFKPVTRYFADCGHSVYLRREAEKGVSCRMHDLEWWAYIEHKIMHEKYSPRAVLYRIKYELHTDDIVSPSTLYSYIHKGYFPHLRMRHCPARIPYRKRTHKRLIKRTYGRSIEQRNISREEIGHWEMDTVVGRREKGPCLLVLTERHTRFEIIRKIEGRTQNAVQKALNDLEREYSGNFSSIFKSITMDNGKEFLNQAIDRKSVV